MTTVVPYFRRFIDTYPTIKSLSSANLEQVLRLWQGLGYYSRARNLHKTAQIVVQQHHGIIPRDLHELQKLPGIGRYTAGAIASIAYNQPAPIVDGNVARILCRLDAIKDDPRDRNTLKKLWLRAEQLVPTDHPGDFNQAMMELGATICTPKIPQCHRCPIARFCNARKQGMQTSLPVPRKSKPLLIHQRIVVCIRNRSNRYLIQQRPHTGRWAGLWQFITLHAQNDSSDIPQIQDEIPIGIKNIRPLTNFSHTLTHRKYQFRVYLASTSSTRCTTHDCRWSTLQEMQTLPFSKPHLIIRSFLTPED